MATSRQMAVHPDFVNAQQSNTNNAARRGVSSSSAPPLSKKRSRLHEWLRSCRPGAKPLSMYKRALVDCDEFDINLDTNANRIRFEDFYKYACATTQSGHLDQEIEREKKAVYKSAFEDFYLKRKETRKKLIKIFLKRLRTEDDLDVQHLETADQKSSSILVVLARIVLFCRPSRLIGK